VENVEQQSANQQSTNQSDLSKSSLSSRKLRAAGIHAGLSFAVFAVFSFLAVFLWFPAPLFVLEGAFVALAIAAGVDLVVGPILTLVVTNAKKSKREQWMDYSLIALMQIGALYFGISQLYKEHPVAMVHYVDSFYLVSHQNIHKQNINELAILENSAGINWKGLPLFAVVDPSGLEENKIALKKMQERELNYWEQLQLYKALPELKESVLEYPLKKYKFEDESIQLKLRPYRGDEYVWKFGQNKYGQSIIVLNDKLEPVAIEVMRSSFSRSDQELK